MLFSTKNQLKTWKGHEQVVVFELVIDIGDLVAVKGSAKIYQG